jgi:hypothetical protein
MAAFAAALVGMSLAAAAQETAHGVTVLRGNTITSEGVVIGVGVGGGPETAPANAANAPYLTGNANAVRTGSANAGGEMGNPPAGSGR